MAHNKEKSIMLLDYYGSLLTEHQLEVLQDYLNEDLSMQEIAENNNVSKSAISDIINRSIVQLESYESNLHLIKQSEMIDKLISKMDKDKNVDKKYIDILNKINRG